MQLRGSYTISDLYWSVTQHGKAEFPPQPGSWRHTKTRHGAQLTCRHSTVARRTPCRQDGNGCDTDGRARGSPRSSRRAAPTQGRASPSRWRSGPGRRRSGRPRAHTGSLRNRSGPGRWSTDRIRAHTGSLRSRSGRSSRSHRSGRGSAVGSSRTADGARVVVVHAVEGAVDHPVAHVGVDEVGVAHARLRGALVTGHRAVVVPVILVPVGEVRVVVPAEGPRVVVPVVAELAIVLVQRNALVQVAHQGRAQVAAAGGNAPAGVVATVEKRVVFGRLQSLLVRSVGARTGDGNVSRCGNVLRRGAVVGDGNAVRGGRLRSGLGRLTDFGNSQKVGHFRRSMDARGKPQLVLVAQFAHALAEQTAANWNAQIGAVFGLAVARHITAGGGAAAAHEVVVAAIAVVIDGRRTHGHRFVVAVVRRTPVGLGVLRPGARGVIVAASVIRGVPRAVALIRRGGGGPAVRGRRRCDLFTHFQGHIVEYQLVSLDVPQLAVRYRSLEDALQAVDHAFGRARGAALLVGARGAAVGRALE
ncbi:exonuclease SbcC [Babesia caballi]|uniref:Exonuclease SbcC n=1 Tax=Babesia caballi TaxID=5871 RepID=A0AAV4LLN3_BABCB|nr:exonuclease SbcC [Babesia caballi]